MSSLAVSSATVSAVIGTMLAKGNFNPNSPYLPQSITILGEANHANQGSITFDVEQQITSAKQAGLLYGYGSPIYDVARILFPASGQAVGVPVYVMPQEEADGAVAKVITITPTGNATANGTIYLRISGRKVKDGGNYAINIESGDTPTLICNKFRAAIAANIDSQVTGSGSSTCIATAKWKGLTSNDINIVVDLNGTSLGTTYAVAETTAGSGTPSVATALTNLGNNWRTQLVNTYGLVSATMTELETANGIPDPTSPTGRYGGTIMRPFIALSGTTLDDPTSITSAGVRPNNVTLVTCPAPLSEGMPYEAAANVAYLLANVFQNKPHGDVMGLTYPDMPGPATGDIPAMNSHTVRDSYVKLGCSTVDYVGGVYKIVDLVTTYNASGEFPPYYRWPRDLNAYWNIMFRYNLKVVEKLWGKTIARDSDQITVSGVVKPKDWIAEIRDLIDGGVRDGLLTDAAFSYASIAVALAANANPNRLDTEFSVKITGIGKVIATTITGGFNFSN